MFSLDSSESFAEKNAPGASEHDYGALINERLLIADFNGIGRATLSPAGSEPLTEDRSSCASSVLSSLPFSEGGEEEEEEEEGLTRKGRIEAEDNRLVFEATQTAVNGCLAPIPRGSFAPTKNGDSRTLA